jgi:hypothetical protein
LPELSIKTLKYLVVVSAVGGERLVGLYLAGPADIVARRDVDRALQDRHVIGSDRNQVPAFFSCVIEYIDIVVFPGHVVQIHFLVFPLMHHFFLQRNREIA